jgi:hypothetical protein
MLSLPIFNIFSLYLSPYALLNAEETYLDHRFTTCLHEKIMITHRSQMRATSENCDNVAYILDEE